MNDETSDLIDQLIADCIRGEEAGQPIDRTLLLAEHPQLANDLRQFFADRDQMKSLARPLAPGRSRHPVGSTVRYFGDYELLEEIARGGMGVVYKARQTSLHRIVAVKMILAGHLADEEDVRRFRSEAEAAASLRHPRIVAVHEVGIHEGQHYFSMDYIEGRNLAEIVRDKPLPARQAAAYVRDVAEAIHAAHTQGTLHRDLKPSNILINADGGVHVTDFGLAMKVEGESDLTRTGQILGTPSYMAPEQAQGNRALVGPASDVYALGVILYELLTGRPPFRTESAAVTIRQVIENEPVSPRVLSPQVQRDLETICLKCLQKEPHKRYATAAELANDLGRYLAGEAILARPVSRWERAGRWCRKNPVVATLSAATLLLLVIVAIGYFREADLRLNVEDSLHELQAEQQRSSQLQRDLSGLENMVEDLEDRRRLLDTSLAEGSQRLALGEEKLYDTYLKLARYAWRNDDVEMADYYLDQCPSSQRNSDWQALRRQCRPGMKTFEGYRCVAMTFDGELLAAGGADNTVKVWEVATGQLRFTLAGHQEEVTAVDFSPDGKLLASSGGNQIILWNLSSGERIRSLEGHADPIVDLDFGPHGLLASASYEWQGGNRGEAIVWNVETSQPVYRLPGLRYVVFNHDGRYLATAQAAGEEQRGMRIVVWRVGTTAEVQPSLVVVNIGADISCRPSFHPLENELAVSKGYDSVEFWDIDSKRIIKRFSGEVQVGCLAYSADGKRLAYTGTTNASSLRPHTFRTIVWNLITGEKERILPWYSSAVVGAAFSNDGRRLVTADGMGIKVWDVTPPPDPTQLILDDIVELDVGQFDWPQWGGSRARINTPAGHDIPTDWDIGEGVSERIRLKGERQSVPNPNYKLAPSKPVGSRNIKWAVPLGSQTYGNPVVANGKLFLGSNNGAGYLRRYSPEIDLGVLLCFDEETGEFLWQHSNEKLPTGRVHDWPLQGVCSTPMVDGDRLWYVSNRGEVVCLDTEGFRDGEDDGPVTNESVRIFDHSINQLLRDFLTAEYAKRQIALPSQWWLKTDETNQRWSVVSYENQPQRTKWYFEIHAAEQNLIVSRYDSLDSPDAKSELFSVECPLLAALGKPAMLEHFRQAFLDAGITVPKHDAEIQTIVNGQQWAFTANVRGIDRNCRLQLRGDQVSGYMSLADEQDEADVVWKFDMMQELGVSQHNMATCSIITVDGMLFVCTSNGLDESHLRIPSPGAPSFMAMDRETGKVIWTDNSPGANILHAQWASPSYGVFDGQPQVIFPGGDGWVYSFDPQGDGQGGSKLLWKFDANPKTSKWFIGGRGTRNNIISFPAIYDGLVYVVMGQDPEHGEGAGHLWCIDPKRRRDGSDISAELAVDLKGNPIAHRRELAVDVSQGERAVPDPNSAVVWHYSYQDQDYDGQISFEEEFHRSISIPVIKDDILYIADFSGLFHCLHAKTGKVYWTYDQLAACWGSALLVDGKVYICDEDGDVAVFRHSADPGTPLEVVTAEDGGTRFVPLQGRWEGDMINEIYMENSIYMTPIVANNVLYIATRNALYAIEQTADAP